MPWLAFTAVGDSVCVAISWELTCVAASTLALGLVHLLNFLIFSFSELLFWEELES